LRQVEGAYQVDLHYLEADQFTIPPEQAPAPAATLHFEIEYVGSETLTIPRCGYEDLPGVAPVRVSWQSDDDVIHGEFVALASAVRVYVGDTLEEGSTGEPAGLTVTLKDVNATSYDDVRLVAELPDAYSASSEGGEAGAGAGRIVAEGAPDEPVYIEVSDASVLNLPGYLDTVRGLQAEPCDPWIRLDPEFGPKGRVCGLPAGRSAVWPLACGGLFLQASEEASALTPAVDDLLVEFVSFEASGSFE
jgi:hypothetical protein